MTTFSSPLNVKVAPETSVAPFSVAGWYTVTITNGKNGLVLTSTTSNTVDSLVIPAGRMLTSYGIACYEPFTGPASTRIDVSIGAYSIKANLPVTVTTANITPDSAGGMVMFRPFASDTTVSFTVSASLNTIPTAGKAILALQIS